MPNYKIEEPGKAGPCIIEAPSYGVAIDYFLASHGMFGYDNLTFEITDEPAEDSLSQVLKIYPEATSKAEQTKLDRHHINAKFLPRNEVERFNWAMFRAYCPCESFGEGGDCGHELCQHGYRAKCPECPKAVD